MDPHAATMTKYGMMVIMLGSLYTSSIPILQGRGSTSGLGFREGLQHDWRPNHVCMFGILAGKLLVKDFEPACGLASKC